MKFYEHSLLPISFLSKMPTFSIYKEKQTVSFILSFPHILNESVI